MIRLLSFLLLWLLSSFLSASAGCAWVLWEMTLQPVSKDALKVTFSDPVSAWTTKEDCEAELEKRMGQGGHRIVRRGVVTDGKGNFFDLRCLPETVDPGKALKSD